MDSSNNGGYYDWYNSSSDLRYYHSTYDNEDAFSSVTSEGSHHLSKLDIETAARGENPLGLKLTKTPSLLSLFSSTSQTNDNFGSPEKLKAANFPALSVQIGSWMRKSRHGGDLTAKCYFKKRQLVWEVLNGDLKRKIEFQWSNIAAIKATFHVNGVEVLDVMLERPPLFFQEVNPQPKKHTNWNQCADFTNNQASLIRKHKLIFGPGVLEKHYNKILQADSKLNYISQHPFPYQASMYFNEIHFSDQLRINCLPIPPEIDLGHATSTSLSIHQDLSPNNNDCFHYNVHDQSQFAISSSVSQESIAHQQTGYVYPSVNAPMTNDVGLQPLGYTLPQEYLQQMETTGSGLPYIGESSHQSSYDYEEDVADHHQFNYEYQSQHYYPNAGGHQWL